MGLQVTLRYGVFMTSISPTVHTLHTYAGLVSSLPYLSQLIVETGLLNASLVFLQQLLSGNVAFAIFRMQVGLGGVREHAGRFLPEGVLGVGGQGRIGVPTQLGTLSPLPACLSTCADHCQCICGGCNVRRGQLPGQRARVRVPPLLLRLTVRELWPHPPAPR